MAFKELKIDDLGCNPFVVFGKMWALLTAGNESDFNTMTIAWGELGTLWDRSIATVFVKPSRYTKQFIDAADDFSISFFGPEQHKALEICGTKSGRDTNKVEASGLSPIQLGNIMTFEEANLVMTCHKLYAAPFVKDGFIEKDLIDRVYPNDDFHTIYIGEIAAIHGQMNHAHPHPMPPRP